MNILGAIDRVVRAWHHFWFEARGTSQVHLFRIGFGLLVATLYAVRAFDATLLFSSEGVQPALTGADAAHAAFRFSLVDVWPTRLGVQVLHTALIISLLSLAAGFLPRLSAIVAFVLHVSFLPRNIAAAYGADLIATFFLLYLCLADYRENWQRPDVADFRSDLGSVAFRLSQS